MYKLGPLHLFKIKLQSQESSNFFGNFAFTVRVWVGKYFHLTLAYPTSRESGEGDFPGGPVAKTPCSQCRGPGFDPWSGN